MTPSQSQRAYAPCITSAGSGMDRRARSASRAGRGRRSLTIYFKARTSGPLYGLSQSARWNAMRDGAGSNTQDSAIGRSWISSWLSAGPMISAGLANTRPLRDGAGSNTPDSASGRSWISSRLSAGRDGAGSNTSDSASGEIVDKLMAERRADDKRRAREYQALKFLGDRRPGR